MRPSARSGHRMAVYKNFIFLFGVSLRIGISCLLHTRGDSKLIRSAAGVYAFPRASKTLVSEPLT